MLLTEERGLHWKGVSFFPITGEDVGCCLFKKGFLRRSISKKNSLTDFHITRRTKTAQEQELTESFLEPEMRLKQPSALKSQTQSISEE